MLFWEILAYFSIGVCYFGAAAVAFGWIKHGIDQKRSKTERVKKQ